VVKIVTLIGDDNQIYRALAIKGKPVKTLIGSKSGTMTFTPLKNDERRADDCPPSGE